MSSAFLRDRFSELSSDFLWSSLLSPSQMVSSCWVFCVDRNNTSILYRSAMMSWVFCQSRFFSMERMQEVRYSFLNSSYCSDGLGRGSPYMLFLRSMLTLAISSPLSSSLAKCLKAYMLANLKYIITIKIQTRPHYTFEMQQEVHSYAFQLKQQTICKSLTSEPHQLAFYASVACRADPNTGYLHKLNYNEDNPRKSQLQTVPVRGQVRSVKAIAFGNEDSRVFVNGGQEGIRLLESGVMEKGEVAVAELQSFSTETNVIDIQKGKDSTLFLISPTIIKSVDPAKPSEPDTTLQLSDGREISHCVVDPAKGFLTYNIQNQILVYDRATKNQKFTFKASPSPSETITNIDYNPNKQYYLMTSHHDYIKFWDIRKSNIPVKIVEEHHSLLLKALYNHAHDELLLGCYDDGAVGLYRMSSVSSSPSGEGSDALVKLYDQHEDSVYEVCWGQSPWVFTSVSYNASSLVVNVVPSVEKYRILL